jgi:predicted transcriptional regulator
MTKKKNTQSTEKLLTEVELELMTILWKIRDGSVHDILEQLPKDRSLAYTSVSTIVRILEQKGILGSRKEGRGHIYFPLLPKEQYEATSLRHLVSKVFDGTRLSLIQRLLETDDLTEDELKSIRNLLNQKQS